MIVCVCHRVSDHDIARAVEDRCDSFAELQVSLRVATACGKCAECAASVLAACQTGPSVALPLATRAAGKLPVTASSPAA